jgi:release factor glutamine methyltransferase
MEFRHPPVPTKLIKVLQRARQMSSDTDTRRSFVVVALAQAGFLSPTAEADALIQASDEGVGSIDDLLARRLRGEPLAWITGSVRFCGIDVRVDRGVFVPRAHTQALARRAASLLPDGGIAVDLYTGSGAVAAVMRAAHPSATVLATDIDPVAVACARANGINARLGDVDEPVPRSLLGRVDVITAVVPYVPTEELHLLPRDVLANEPRYALDGGTGGTVVLVRAADASARWLRPGGTVLLELGGDQADEIAKRFESLGLGDIRIHRDEERRDRAIEARRPVETASAAERNDLERT